MRQTLPWLVVFSLATPVAHAAGDAERCAEQGEQAPVLRDEGKLVEALRLYEGCAVDSCPRVVRDDCRAALLELRKSVPRIAVHVRDEHGADLSDAQVTVDGAAVAADEYARGLPIDPGAHVIRAVRPPLREVEEKVVVAAGEPLRVVDLTLGAALATPPTPPHLEETPHLKETPRGGASRNHTAAFVVGSIGLASLAAWGVFGAWTLVDYTSLTRDCPSCTSSQIQDAHTRGYVADVFLGTAAVALAVATVLWFTAPARKPPTLARR